ncbi:MAG: hypothetical protein JNK30_12925 [Phenylobacterium sp.]|uniref:hypothetical protein n=1 Tax=Phenylobacterium sp. TaxID=1871053 RepID=UPI001A4C2C1A|nr:hypothetical protein [Phenylobacterium sp.]MBL8772278.1 hypothetical protein [Phenylobacterium sp.]
MDMPVERVPEAPMNPDLDDVMAALSPLDPQESLDLHRAINERRASIENAELLRRLRSL